MLNKGVMEQKEFLEKGYHTIKIIYSVKVIKRMSKTRGVLGCS